MIDTTTSNNWPIPEELTILSSQSDTLYTNSHSNQLLINPQDISIENLCLEVSHYVQQKSDQQFYMDLYYLLHNSIDKDIMTTAHRQLLTSTILNPSQLAVNQFCLSNYISFQSTNYSLLIQIRSLDSGTDIPIVIFGNPKLTQIDQIDLKTMHFLLPSKLLNNDEDNDPTQNWITNIESFEDFFEFDEDQISFSCKFEL